MRRGLGLRYTLTRTALPELEPPADLVWSAGFRTGPLALVKLFPEKHWFSHVDFPRIVPPYVV